MMGMLKIGMLMGSKSKEIVIAVYRPCGCEIHACVDNIEEVKNNFPIRCKFHIESTHQETGGYSLGWDW